MKYQLKEKIDEFRLTLGKGIFTIKRGEKSIANFILVYLFLINILIGTLSIIPNNIISWGWRLFLIIILAIGLFRLCFKVEFFKQFLVRFFDKLKNDKYIK